MLSIVKILTSRFGFDRMEDYRNHLKKKIGDKNGTVPHNIAFKLFKTLIEKSNEYHPTVVSNLRNFFDMEVKERCNACSKRMKRLQPHKCLDRLKLQDLAQSWPRLNRKFVCIFACECEFTNYRSLAEHYLEHNWDDLKFFGIHPDTLYQLVEER
jgi:hypothetical protein